MTLHLDNDLRSLPSFGELVEALLAYVEVSCRDPMATDDEEFEFNDMAQSTYESISYVMDEAGVFVLVDPKFSFRKVGCPRDRVAAVVEANAKATLCYWEVVEVSLQLIDHQFGDRNAGSSVRKHLNWPEAAAVAASARLFDCLAQIGVCARAADGQLIWTDQSHAFKDCHRPSKACSGSGCLAAGRRPVVADLAAAILAPKRQD